MVYGNNPINGKEAQRMCYSSQGRFRGQVDFLRHQFLQDGGLPFTDVLTERSIATSVVSWA